MRKPFDGIYLRQTDPGKELDRHAGALYFRLMRICQSCKKEISTDLFIGRQSSCPSCRADLHVCLNCSFYEPGAYNDCRESQAERVLDKDRANFCDYFRYREGPVAGDAKKDDARKKLDALFK